MSGCSSLPAPLIEKEWRNVVYLLSLHFLYIICTLDIFSTQNLSTACAPKVLRYYYCMIFPRQNASNASIGRQMHGTYQANSSKKEGNKQWLQCHFGSSISALWLLIIFHIFVITHRFSCGLQLLLILPAARCFRLLTAPYRHCTNLLVLHE